MASFLSSGAQIGVFKFGIVPSGVDLIVLLGEDHMRSLRGPYYEFPHIADVDLASV
ncbi:hypothetical protein C1H46_035397 [Malus baccata]|uniref:Uncharacterized protein n=1 Tax=Malus baccata TaxID=106549 RepID=A0A540KXU4_MALBA|nr:hypothetical protein C1H46_035397 [Malus baccata]